MLPYKTIIRLDDKSRVPKYLQICNAFIKNISTGKIASGLKLPGSRQLSELLDVNRRTVISAFDELASQGWIIVKPNQGCFVTEKLPEIKPKSLSLGTPEFERKSSAFQIQSRDEAMKGTADSPTYDFKINDGYPDVRLAPLKDLARNFSYIMNSSLAHSLMSYRQAYFGDQVLREELVKYLAETRSINVSVNNIMVTRGSLMALHILFKTILKKGDTVIVGYPGYNECHNAIKLAEGRLQPVQVDKNGMNVEAVEELCKKKKIRAVYVIPHHHYPTTVSLSASRRIKLLQLAEKYGFAIVEDDYDYDFHYASSPILPIASTDYLGSVAYVGSFSKTVAPSLRLGFIVAPENLIQEVSYVSRYMDSHGNTALERAVGMLFQDGLIRRHLRKALKTYRDRRDHFCGLLESELSNHIDFDMPEGGLAVWTQLKNHPLEKIEKIGKKNRMKIPDGASYFSKPYQQNSLRIGFASMTKVESEKLIESMIDLFKKTENQI